MKNLVYLVFACSTLSFVSCKSQQACIDESKIKPEAICTMEYNPVCGCDGKTYGNPCQAENAGVTQYERGECKQ